MTTFDYVIVGAGSAGCVLANRLSADPQTKVAVLEAGGRDRKMEIRIPAAFGKLFKSDYDWNFTTAAQPALDDRELYWPRGKTLGGSSSINAQMWLRGQRADYDGWADEGCPGWSYDVVRPYFERAERRQGSNVGGVYGTAGPNRVSELRDANPTTQAFLAACAELGLHRPDELNGADIEGYGPTPVMQRKGRRWSAADAYLRPVSQRKNLTVLTNATTQRVLLNDGRATGVEYRDAGGQTQRLSARRDVILSAGAIGSPQLLQLSGIGDADQLRAAGVEPTHELPGVGRNLQDHLLTGVIVNCTEPVTLVDAEKPINLLRFVLFRKGLLTSNVGEAAAFVRTSDDLAAPDIELIFAPAPYIDHGLTEPPGHGLSIGVILLQPESRGQITLASSDPAAAPVIDPAYLSKPSDLATQIAGVRLAGKVFDTAALRGYVGESIEPDPTTVIATASDDDLAAFVREQSETLYHPVGTCRMGEGDDAVVDPELGVRGLDGLRVVDASVMPRIIRGHTHAPTVMIAERAADLIRQA
ncbi:MAG TPA: GMC family oxidoreductase N-terminal domain-containing protein [Acidimicrobiales bacterium]|jgi:choline dehydrogenase